MKFIETHCHLDLKEFNDDRKEIITQSLDKLLYLINIGATNGLNGLKNSIELAKKYEQIFFSAGIHPNNADLEIDWDFFETSFTDKKLKAIGETGLDFFRDNASKDNQYDFFIKQINYANQLNLPIIIHCRDAATEVLEVLQNNPVNKGGVFHCFYQSYDYYKKLKDIGFIVSIPGIVTFKNAKELQETVKKIDINDIMLETDAPYLAPTPYRGKRNQPVYLIETAKKIADLQDISLEEVADITTQTALKFFNLPNSL